MKTNSLAAFAIGLCLSSPCLAADAVNEPQALLYLTIPFGSDARKDRAPVLGFALRRGSDSIETTARPFRQISLLEIQFDAKRTVRVMGLPAIRLSAGEEGTEAGGPTEVNWLIVGGAVVGAVVLIAAANRSKSTEPQRCFTASVPPMEVPC